MAVTIILAVIVAAILALNIRAMVRNLRAGKDIGGCGGCGGDCAKCHGCHHSPETKNS